MEMSDKLTRNRRPTAARSTCNHPHEIHYRNVSRKDLQRAIDRVGNGAAAARKEVAAK